MTKKTEKTRGGARPGAGRPSLYKTPTQPITAALPAKLVEELDDWAAAQEPAVTRSQAVVEFVQRGLRAARRKK